MAVAALVVAIMAVVVAVFAAAYARTQAVAAKGSLAIEQARYEAEMSPRFEADVTGGNEPQLRLRLLPDQLPMTGVGLRIVQGGNCASFDESRKPSAGGRVETWWQAWLDEVLFPGAQTIWPLKVHDAEGGEVALEIADLGRPGRVAAVTVSVPPRASIRFLEL
jgi:hypothetical protein